MRELKKPHFSMAGWGLFLAGALTLSSCSNEDLPGGEEQGPAIEFGEVKTRAEVTEATQVREFSVFAEMNYLLEDGTESTDFISLLDNERVYRMSEEESADFTYDNKRYWVEDRTFNFFAVYPYMESNVERADLTSGESSYDGYTIDFTTTASADTDLMAAHNTVLTLTNYPFPESVNMPFQHLLTKINFNIKKNAEQNADDEFKIIGIGIIGIKNQGTYKTSYSPNYTDNWEVGNSTMSYSKEFDDKEITTGGITLFNTGEEPLLIPQQNEGVTLYIAYTYKMDGAETATTKQTQATLPTSEWAAGKQIMYNLTLTVDNYIYFSTPTVEPWGAMQSGGTIIIK